MRISCVLGRHEAGDHRVRNRGMTFACCDGCGRELVRSRKAWRPVPKGFRVVWRRAGAPEAQSTAQLLFDLPASGRALALSRATVRRPGRIAATVELVALGTRGLAWALAERFRAWTRALLAPRPHSRPMLSLPAG